MKDAPNFSSYFFSDLKLNPSTRHFILAVLFFLSGISALIYQLMWQRMLFTVFGVDLESITVIVAVFMFGLGIGGMLGGYIADKMIARLLALYIAIEFSIAIFGFFSPRLIETIGNGLWGNSEWITFSVSFAILAFPTILMGATFPILVTYVNQTNQHIGRSVGSLYFANTLGGATGAYFSGFVLLYSLDLAGAVNRAAMLNLIIAAMVFLIFRRK